MKSFARLHKIWETQPYLLKGWS